ncbi:DoxX family protein [Alicyclobacillus curvatus]|jgi:thiosulfate dehydrogenase (quinone) large subunit|nr:DoxX family protein [Alicyclobacillus curvatus]
MFTEFLRKNVWAAGILTILRVYLGWGFLTAGWEKITGAEPFSAAGFLQGAVAKPVFVTHSTVLEYPNYVAFLKSFAIPNVGLFNFLVPWGELFVGIGLITGTLTTAAVFFGMMMNFAYMFAGTISSNPWDVLIGLFIIVAGYNAGKFGGDYWVIPWIRQHVTSWLHHEIEIGSGTGGKAVH